MIIVHLNGGLGNQLFQYATGLRLAIKHNTELKLDLSFFRGYKLRSYILDLFNVRKNFATQEDIKRLLEIYPNNTLGLERSTQIFMPEVLDYPDDVYLRGSWESERYFPGIADILREEFTLMQPLNSTAQQWREKILAADCSVSLHVRHGDFAYNLNFQKYHIFAILPPEYYYECLNQLKRENPNLTAFVFSDDLNWCKANLHLGVPTEFVEGCAEHEDFHLMSLCRHNIIANSTFSWWAAWLNQNPDKKVFVPIPSSFVGTQRMYRHFLPERNENSPLESDRWTRVTFDLNNQPNVEMCPYFSLLIVVNDDVASVAETLNSVIGQDYKYYEVIIIDNASTDGSGKICRQIAKAHDNVTLIKLYDKISDGAAWNKALNIAQGKYVLFMKGDDKIFPDTLTSLYSINERPLVDVVNATMWLREDLNGALELGSKKFSTIVDEPFRDFNKILMGKMDKPTIIKILSGDNRAPLGSKVFKRKFLADNAIKFNENLADAQLPFMTEAMLKAHELIFSPTLFYIAPILKAYDPDFFHNLFGIKLRNNSL